MTLNEFRQKMERMTDDGRFAEWLRLVQAQEEVSQNILEDVSDGTDPVLKIFFARFLAQIPDERAVKYLGRLIADSNKVVRESAQRAYEKNSFDNKWALLVVLLESSSLPAQYYAIEKLSQAIVVGALERILAKIPHADEKLLLHILKALRYFADERVFPAILPFLKDAREEVRFRATLVLGTLYEADFRPSKKLFHQALKDLSSKIRLAVLWGLRTRPSKQHLKFLLPISLKDPDPLVRAEALLEMANFGEKTVILHLLKILVVEKEPIVLLKAEALFYDFSQKVLLSILGDLVVERSGAIRQKAVWIMSNLSYSLPRLEGFLLKELRKTKNTQDLLPLLAALGNLRSRKSVPVLEMHLKENPLAAYTAIGSLLNIWGHFPKDVPIHRYLLDPQMDPLLKQTILKQMLKKGKWENYVGEMPSILLRLLDDPNLNIRYLSAQILTGVSSQEILLKTFDTVLKEKDPAFIKFLRESLCRQLTQEPSWAGSLLAKYKQEPSATEHIFLILEMIDIFGEVLVGLFILMMQPPISIHLSEYQERFKKYLTWSLQSGRVDIFSVLFALKDLEEKGEALKILAQIVSQNQEIPVQVPIDFFEKWFQTEKKIAQEAMIVLLSNDANPRALRFLISILCNEQWQSLHPKASLGVGHFAQGAS